MTQVLISGATGFVGSMVARRCQEAGLIVRSMGRSREPSVSLPNYIQADLLDPISLAPLLKDVNILIHAAGLAHQFGRRGRDPGPFMEVNVEAASKIARAAADAGIQHFVLLSSVSVYGSPEVPAGSCGVEEGWPCRPEGPYAKSKYLGEQKVEEIARSTGMRLTILRLATVYGAGDPGNVARLMCSIDRGRFIWIGHGSNRKSLIHRDDVARACIAVLQSPGEGIEVYNVSGPPCAMREVVEGLATALGRRLPRWYVPALLALGLAQLAATVSGGRGRLSTLGSTLQKWLADDVYSAAKFEAAFQYKVEVGLGEGLAEEVSWYRKNG